MNYRIPFDFSDIKLDTSLFETIYHTVKTVKVSKSRTDVPGEQMSNVVAFRINPKQRHQNDVKASGAPTTLHVFLSFINYCSRNFKRKQTMLALV